MPNELNAELSPSIETGGETEASPDLTHILEELEQEERDRAALEELISNPYNLPENLLPDTETPRWTFGPEQVAPNYYDERRLPEFEFDSSGSFNTRIEQLKRLGIFEFKNENGTTTELRVGRKCPNGKTGVCIIFQTP